MAKAFVEIIGDAESFVMSLRKSQSAVSTFKGDLASLDLSVSKSAEAQVKASALRISRIRDEISAVQQLAAAYAKGSDEQIAAMDLVARKQAQLARMTGASSVVAARGGVGMSKTSEKKDEREASGLVRGVVSGSGIGHVGLAALSGGAFFGTYLAASTARTAIENAEDLAKAQDSVDVSLKKIGADVSQVGPQIDKWAQAQASLGVSTIDATKGFASMLAFTGNARSAMQAYTASLELARVTNRSLSQVEVAVARAAEGQTTALSRYGVTVQKGTTWQQLYNQLQAKFAGQSQANTSASDRFRASLTNVETTVGQALLPTVDRLLNEGAKWMSQMQQSGRLQKDVNTVLRDAGVAAHIAEDGFRVLRTTVGLVDKATGSFKTTLELLIGLKFASTLSGWLGGLTGLKGGMATAETEAEGLRGTLSALTVAPYVITVEVIGLEKVAAKIKALQEQELNSGQQSASTDEYKRLVPNLAKTIQRDVRSGMPRGDIISSLEKQLGGGPNASDLVAAAFNYSTGPGSYWWKRLHPKTAPAKTSSTGHPKPSEITKFGLSRADQNALAAAETPSQDLKAAQHALAGVQAMLNSGRLAGKAYTDALKERKKLYAEIARDQKKLRPGGGSSGSLLPAGVQGDLAKAQGDAATKSLPALQSLLSAQQQALQTLKSQHDVGADRLKQLKEEAQLEKQIATTQKQIAAGQLSATKVRDTALAHRILGIGKHPTPSAQQSLQLRERGILNQSLSSYLAPSLTGKDASQELSTITKKTSGLNLTQLVKLTKDELGDKLPNAALAELDKFNKLWELKFLPPDVLATVRNRLTQLDKTVQSGLGKVGQTTAAYHKLSAQQFVHGVAGLTRTQRIAFEERFSQVQAHGGVPVGPAALGQVIPRQGDTHFHGPINVNGVDNLDKLIGQIERRTGHKLPRRGRR